MTKSCEIYWHYFIEFYFFPVYYYISVVIFS